MEVNPPPSRLADAGSRELSVDTALHAAYLIWFGLFAFPFVIFLAVIWRLMDSENSSHSQALAQNWFIAVMAYMAIGVPLAFFWRSRTFKGYWTGQCVAPCAYLSGMCTIWIALEVGGLLALTGCLVSGTMLPNLLPAMLAFMLFIPLWPSGQSMVRPLENERDPAHYAEPR